MSDSDDDVPQLSAATLAALGEFYSEQKAAQEKLQAALDGDLEQYRPDEDWNKSQFWYDDATATRLAEAALAECGDEGRIACVSAPTAYQKLRQLRSGNQELRCLEFDERFAAYGDDFLLYDYNQPLQLPGDWKGRFDVVLTDPPFLNEDCLCKTAQTVRFLAKEKVIVCTGAVMGDLVKKLLKAEEQTFKPSHTNNLANEFRCYANFHSPLLQKQ